MRARGEHSGEFGEASRDSYDHMAVKCQSTNDEAGYYPGYTFLGRNKQRDFSWSVEVLTHY